MLLLSVFGLTLGIGVLYGGYQFATQSPDDEASGSTQETEPSKYLAGGEVVTGEASTGGGTMTVELDGAAAAKVSISATLTGFNYKWNGSDVLTLKELTPGPYRVRIRTSESSVVLQSTVERGRTCAYRYDLDGESEDWDQAGC